MTTKLTVIVQNTDKCIVLLRFLEKNIQDLVRMNVKLIIKKINNDDSNAINTLTKLGITNLPTLIAPDGKLFVGVTEITKLINSNINSIRHQINNKNDTDDVRSFLMNQMYDNVNGSMVPKKDIDEENDEVADFEKKLKSMKLQPSKNLRSDNIQNNPIQDDNVATIDSATPISKQSCLDAISDEADRKMMSAWLDNIPNEY